MPTNNRPTEDDYRKKHYMTSYNITPRSAVERKR